MRLWCWLTKHNLNLQLGYCRRCGLWEPWKTLPLDQFVSAVTRLLTAYAANLEKPQPKPELEVVQPLPAEIESLFEMARTNDRIKSRLPEHLREMLDEEAKEWEQPTS